MARFRIAVSLAGTVDVDGPNGQAAADLLKQVIKLHGLKIGRSLLKNAAASVSVLAEVVPPMVPQPAPNGEHHLKVDSVVMTPKVTH